MVLHGRLDVSEFLIKKHQASINIADLDGYSVLHMATSATQLVRLRSSQLVKDVAMKRGMRDRRDKKEKCYHCGNEITVSGTFLSQCARW